MINTQHAICTTGNSNLTNTNQQHNYADNTYVTKQLYYNNDITNTITHHINTNCDNNAINTSHTTVTPIHNYDTGTTYYTNTAYVTNISRITAVMTVLMF